MKKSKWTTGQINLLLEKTRNGCVRMHAFEEVARQTKRKPNSVRNFYYKLISNKKDSSAVLSGANLNKHSKMIFKPFETGEVKNLLREIILGTSRGESVRKVCLHLANNNKNKMLRYQNKYRAILKKSPHQINEITRVLEAQGFFVKNPITNNGKHQIADSNRQVINTAANKITFDNKLIKEAYKAAEDKYKKSAAGSAASNTISTADNIILMPQQNNKKLSDADINNLFMGLVRLVKKNVNDEQVTGLKNQVELLKSELERLKNKAKKTKISD